MMKQKKSIKKSLSELYFSSIDYWLLSAVLIVSVIGLFTLYKVLSSGYEGRGQIMFIRQLAAVVVGLLIALVLGAIQPPTLKIMAYLVYGISVLLLLVVLVDGFTLEDTTGADSWLMLPLIGSFQPSELAKIGVIMLSSYFFADIKSKKISGFKGGLILFMILMIPLELIRRQPDLGTILVFIFIFVSMLFVFGLSYKYLLLALSASVAVLPLIWSYVLRPHQKNRILTFIFPGFSPSQVFHIEQAKAAIRVGGLTGSKLDYPIHVPVKESDFIYTAVSEHMGFIGTSALVFFIFFFIIRALVISSKVKDNALKYMAAGIGVMFGVHSIENLGMCVGLMPITGIPLPFVSLGGSAMIVNFFALGLLIGISAEHKRLTSDF